MGLGSTAKKIQMVADTAEKMYTRLNELREQLDTTQSTVQDTGDRVQQLESEIVEQRAILEAVATELNIDLDAVSADAHIRDAEAAAAASDAESATGDPAAADEADAEPTDGDAESEA
jgi:archaellum component FlaC